MNCNIFPCLLANLTLLVLLLFLGNSRLVGQVEQKNTISRDSIPEIIVYEYDTVYVAPDTIRYTDTIVHLIPVITSVRIPKTETGVFFTPFITGISNSNLKSDSLTLHATVNYHGGIRFTRYTSHFAWYLQAGYESVHSKLYYTNSYSTKDDELSGVYDSLQVSGNYKINNYYDYFYMQPGFGKRWELKRFVFSLYAYGLYSFLYKHTDTDTYSERLQNELSINSVQKTSWSAGAQIDFGFRITSRILFHIAPTYQYKFNAKNFYPLGDSHRLGVTSGVAILF
jgi:hypothetical protein